MTEKQRERTYVDDACDDLLGLIGQIGAVIYLMGGYSARLDHHRNDMRAYLTNIADQVMGTVVFLSDQQRLEGREVIE